MSSTNGSAMEQQGDGGASATVLNVGGCARYIGRKESWVRSQWRATGLPAIKVGRELKFRPADLDRWLDSHMVENGQEER